MVRTLLADQQREGERMVCQGGWGLEWERIGPALPHLSLRISQAWLPLPPGSVDPLWGESFPWAPCTSGPGGLWVRVSAEQPVVLFRSQLWGKSVWGFSQIPNLEAKLMFMDPRPQNSRGHDPLASRWRSPLAMPGLSICPGNPRRGGGRNSRVPELERGAAPLRGRGRGRSRLRA